MRGTIQEGNCVDKFSDIILTDMGIEGIKCCVAGGAVRDYFMGVPVKTDIDLFFRSEKDMKKADEYFTKAEAKVVWDSPRGKKFKHGKKTFDLVKTVYGKPSEIISKFDFTASMFAVDSDRVYFGETSFVDLAKRQLIINELPFPISTMKRSFRYYSKGFRMCSEEMGKLALAIQKEPLNETQKEEESTEAPPSGEDSAMFWGID